MSATPRLYVKSDLSAKSYAALSADQEKYLTRVLRLKAGDEVRVFNGRDGEWLAIIDEVIGKTVLLKAERLLKPFSASEDLWLLFAPLKKTRTDFVVEKAAELGVSVIRPVMTERTQASRVNTDRLQATAMEAAEQTERQDLPVVEEPAGLDAVLAGWNPARTLIFADEAGDDEEADWGGEHGRAEPMLDVLKTLKPGPAAILIGPEGGFSPEERKMLRSLEFVTPVSLGPRILRAETAAVSALTLWQAALGDWRPRS
ncbi:MAG: 16S rRNA (uracil(1498)-N(3))-methyltransferase [Pseudomonadota bacterium]